jgi:ferric-dicitrate binding protein FerR (iron transport regulator)
MSKQKNYQELVRRYLENKASDEELEIFFHLMREGTLKPYLEEALGQEALHQPKRFPFIAVAALLIALLSGAGFWFAAHRQHGKVLSQQVTVDVQPGRNHAILMMEGGHSLDLDSQSNTAIVLQAHASLHRNARGEWVYHGSMDTAVSFDILSAPRGGQLPFILDDGTKVWLNAASSLTFPTAFKGDSREVTLEGEAYFEVARDARKSFVVHAGKDRIQVLGTAFNVNAYSDEAHMRTTLVGGAVRVWEGTNSVLMEPGQIVYFNQDGSVRKSSDADEVEAALSWKNGYFSFADDDISTVMRQISRWYDVDVRYEGPPTEARFGGDIERDLTLMQVLKVLEKSQVHFRLDGRVLTVLP